MRVMNRKLAKSRSNAAVARKRSSKSTPGYDIIGTTREGISILRPKMKPRRFTSKQIREAIIEVENSSSE
jgi:hypothetical protein